jgi:hypothetical protein
MGYFTVFVGVVEGVGGGILAGVNSGVLANDTYCKPIVTFKTIAI